MVVTGHGYYMEHVYEIKGTFSQALVSHLFIDVQQSNDVKSGRELGSAAFWTVTK